MPKKITRLRINECSLVDEPANIGAQILLWKRHDDTATTTTTESDMSNDADLGARVDELESLVGTLTKANETIEKSVKSAEDRAKELEKKLADAEAAKAAAETAKAAAEAELAKATAPKPEPETEKLTKGMTFEQREAFESLQKSVKEHEEQLVKMRELSEEREAVIKVEKAYPSLPVKAKDFGPVYRKITKTLGQGSDELAIFERILSSYGQLAEIATSSMGRNGHLPSGDAWAEAQAKAADLRKSSPQLSQDQAIAKVYEADPDLYRRYLADEATQ